MMLRISYNSTLSACEKAADWATALLLFDDFKKRQLRAGVITYSAVISACEKAAAWQQALCQLVDLRASHLEAPGA